VHNSETVPSILQRFIPEAEEADERQACFKNNSCGHRVSSSLHQKCLRCTKQRRFCLPQNCTEDERNQREFAQRVKSSIVHYSIAEVEIAHRCQVYLQAKSRCSGVSSNLAKKCLRCTKYNRYCLPQNCTKEERKQGEYARRTKRQTPKG